MTTVTGMTAEAMEAIRDGVVVDGEVVGDNLILTKYDASTINAGNVRGAQGPVGPAGLSFLNVLANQSILEVGMSGQIKAGHKLRLVDFSTLLGLPTVPVGLFNLTNLTNLGSGGNLVNKNAVTFVSDILGVAGEAAQLRGASGIPANDPVLYIDDTGGADPFRIKTGSIGCWFKSPKRGLTQSVITKIVTGGASADILFQLYVLSNNTINAACYAGGASWSAGGIMDICDDKWHHVVVTYDANFIRIHLDGLLEAIAPMGGVIAPTGFGPFNIGGFGGNAGTNVSQPFYGRVDEAFVTHDILSEDEVRLLYSAAIAHGFGAVPKSVIININRRRKGAAIVSGDFPNQPLRGYNLDTLNDFGSGGVLLTANPSTGAIAQAPGPDGTKDTARRYTGTHQGDSGSAAGLPTTGARSMGCWFKTTGTTKAPMGYGTPSGEGAFNLNVGGTGLLNCDTWTSNRVSSSQPVNDGQWHHAVVTYDPAPTDLLRFKLYIDGKLVDAQVGAAITTDLTVTANRFRVGSYSDGTTPFLGDVARAFLYQGALTESQVRALYLKSGQDLGPSPKDAGDHVEGMDATYVYGIFDSLETQHKVNLAVAA